MLGCLTERLEDISEEADLTCFGQEFNPETYAIAKADMLIKGGNASGMMYGDTLSDDKFDGYSVSLDVVENMTREIIYSSITSRS